MGDIPDMASTPTQEGHLPFRIPSVETPCFTFYKVFGDLSCGKPAVIVLHGGPGGGHESNLPFAELWPRYGLPVIFYDQIGCAGSTHLPQKNGDRAFWQEELFVAELQNLLDFFKLQDESSAGFHLHGHSWGGCLASAFAATRPKGLQRLVLASAVASLPLSTESIHLLVKGLPADVQEGLLDAERRGDYESPAYKDAMALFAKKHICRLDPFPPEMDSAFKHLAEDRTVNGTMYGPSTLTCNGSISEWTVIPRLPQITAKTLIFNGEFDSSHDLCTAPFFEHIPHARWITFSNASHMCHLEESKERCMSIVGDFLAYGTYALPVATE